MQAHRQKRLALRHPLTSMQSSFSRMVHQQIADRALQVFEATQVRGLQLDLVAFGIGTSLHEKFRRWRVAPEPEKERTYKVLDEILTFYSTLSALDSRLSPRYFSGRLIPVVAFGCPLVWRSTSECGAGSTLVCLTLLAVRSWQRAISYVRHVRGAPPPGGLKACKTPFYL